MIDCLVMCVMNKWQVINSMTYFLVLTKRWLKNFKYSVYLGGFLRRGAWILKIP